MKIILAIYFIIAPIYHQTIIPSEIWYGVKLLFLSLLILMIAITIIYKQKILLGYTELVFLIVFTVSSFYLLSEDTVIGVFSLCFLFFYIGKNCSNLLTQKEFINLIIWIARVSAIYIIWTFIYYFNGPKLSVSGNINPNSWALYLTVCVSSLFYSYFIRKRFIDLLLLSIIIGALIFTGSRGGFLIAVLMFLTFLAFQKSRYILIYGSITIALFLLLILYNEYFHDTRLHQQIMTLKNGGHLDLTTGRWDGFVTAIRIVENNLLFGMGPVDLTDYGHNHIQIHNYFLRILIENGLALLIPTIIFLTVISYRLLKVNENMKLLARFCFILLLTPLFYEPNGFLGNFMISGKLWFIIGYLNNNNKHEFFVPFSEENFHS